MTAFGLRHLVYQAQSATDSADLDLPLIEASTAINTIAPPKIVILAGTSTNSKKAKKGASGVSEALKRAV